MGCAAEFTWCQAFEVGAEGLCCLWWLGQVAGPLLTCLAACCSALVGVELGCCMLQAFKICCSHRGGAGWWEAECWRDGALCATCCEVYVPGVKEAEMSRGQVRVESGAWGKSGMPTGASGRSLGCCIGLWLWHWEGPEAQACEIFG